MFKNIFETFLLISACVSLATATAVEPCDDDPLPDSVDVIGCTTPPCILLRGTDVVMLMNFTAPKDEPVTKMRATVWAKVPGVPGLPYPLPNDDVCKELTNTHCPLEENEPAVYKLQMPILEIYPETDLQLTFSVLHNGGRKKLACFIVKCKVVKE